MHRIEIAASKKCAQRSDRADSNVLRGANDWTLPQCSHGDLKAEDLEDTLVYDYARIASQPDHSKQYAFGNGTNGGDERSRVPAWAHLSATVGSLPSDHALPAGRDMEYSVPSYPMALYASSGVEDDAAGVYSFLNSNDSLDYINF